MKNMDSVNSNMPLERAPSKLLKLLAKQKTDSATAADIEVLLQTPPDKLDAQSRMWLKFARVTLEQNGTAVATREIAMPFQAENDRPEGVTAREILDEATRLAGLDHSELIAKRKIPIAPPVEFNSCEGREKWRFKVGQITNPSLVPDKNGALHVGTHENELYSIDKNGTLNWCVQTTAAMAGSLHVTNDGRAFIGNHEDNQLHVLNAEGTAAWTFQTEATVCSPALTEEDGSTYVATRNGNVHAIGADKSEKWKFITNGRRSPFLAKGPGDLLYVVGRDKDIFGVDSKGNEKWKFETTLYLNQFPPAVAADGTIYVTGSGNKVYAINPDGTEKWCFNAAGEAKSGPTVGPDGRIYVAFNNHCLYAITPEGKLDWKNDGFYFKFQPAVAADHSVYVVANDIYLLALDSLGKEKWRIKTDEFLATGASVDEDGTVYFGSGDGYVCALE